jgi:hypothetical protein
MLERLIYLDGQTGYGPVNARDRMYLIGNHISNGIQILALYYGNDVIGAGHSIHGFDAIALIEDIDYILGFAYRCLY